jgi:hypothetical protein
MKRAILSGGVNVNHSGQMCGLLRLTPTTLPFSRAKPTMQLRPLGVNL